MCVMNHVNASVSTKIFPDILSFTSGSETSNNDYHLLRATSVATMKQTKWLFSKDPTCCFYLTFIPSTITKPI